MSDKDKIIIYTIGHSNIRLEEFLNVLKAKKIKTLIDVRSIPFSKYAFQFNKENIGQALKSEGIEYVYLGDFLGGKSIIKEGGVLKLMNIAEKSLTAIMCAEENPYQCHRNKKIVQPFLPLLLKRGIRVVHIRKEGEEEKAVQEPIQQSFIKI